MEALARLSEVVAEFEDLELQAEAHPAFVGELGRLRRQLVEIFDDLLESASKEPGP
jgi:hypothetical protein